MAEGTASVVIQKGMTVLSLVVYIFMSLALAPFVLLGDLPHLGLLSLGAILLAGAAIAFIIVQRSHPCVSVIGHMKKLSLCPEVLISKEAELATLDSYLADFYRKHADRCITAFVLLVLGWGLHSLEVYIIFILLGHPINWGTAVCLDGLTMLFTGLGFMIPVSLGVQDGEISCSRSDLNSVHRWEPPSPSYGRLRGHSGCFWDYWWLPGKNNDAAL
jgi:hypothetical protein